MSESFSIVWKNRRKFFHCVEKSAPVFPQCGKLFSTLWKTGLAAACAALPAWAGEPAVPATNAPAPAPWVVENDWGPLASWLDDSDGNARFRAAGPFWEQAESPDGKTLTALPRPLWACAADPAAGKTSWDCLWPVAAGKTFGPEKSWRVLLAWFLDADRTDPQSPYRFWALPVWFHGRSREGEPYAALFPAGGKICNLLTKDRVRFVLWPLWIQSQIHDVKTTDVLWPIFSRTTTPDHHLEGRRVFPFYSWTKNVPQYEKTAILWPIWTYAHYTHPKANGTAWILFPLCGRVNLNSQQGWMFLPPFFQHIRSEQLERTVILWPFFVRETGVREKLYCWPFYGFRKDGALERRYWIWPLIIHEQNDWGRRKLNRWSVIPFYNNVTQTENPAAATGKPAGGLFGVMAGPRLKPAPASEKPAAPGAVIANRTKLWPLYSRQYDLSEASYRLRLLDLWPAGQPPAVERSWAPLWTVLDYRVRGTDSDLDVLWGLYRQTRRVEGARAFSLFPLWQHERTGGDAARRWSVLKGLLAYDRTATNRQMRVLWLGRISLKPAGAAAPEEPQP